jgi:hypothetical protein
MTFGARWDDDEAKIVFKMYQVSAGGSYNARVGIGTTSPNRDLHINGPSDVRIQITDSDQGTTSNDGMYIRQFGVNAAIVNQENGSLQFGTNNNYVITLLSGGNVGIGTTSPSYTLQVNGSGYFNSTLYVNGATTVDDNFYVTNGNVGIGTTSPSAPLHVYKDAGDGNSVMRIRNTNSTFKTTLLQFEDYAGAYADGLIAFNVKSGAAAGSYLGIGVSTTGSLVVAYGGNVGIATTSPSALLHIQGLGASPDSNSVYITNKRGGYFPLRILATQGDYQGVLIEHQDGDGSGGAGPSGSYGFKFDDKRVSGTYTGHPSASFVIARSNTYNNTNIFEVRPYNTQPAIAVSTAGKVGIGTATPISGLLSVKQSGTNFYDGIVSYASASDAFISVGHTGTLAVVASTYNSSAGWKDLAFYTQDSDRLHIKADGNVGIGTTDPNTLLVVRKAVNNEWIAKFINTGTNPYGMYVDTSANTSSTYTFAAYTYGGLGLFVINNTGNVGIGTTAPGNKLQVAGNAWINRPTNKVDNGGATEFGSRVEFNNAFGSGASGYTVFNYPSATVFRIYGDYDGNVGGVQPDLQLGLGYLTVKNSGGTTGYVGIGTTSPGYKLDVNASSTSDGLRVQNAGTSKIIANGDGVLFWGAAADYGSLTWDTGFARINAASSYDLRMTTSAGGLLVLKSGGNVGINTTDPSSALHVYSNGGSFKTDLDATYHMGILNEYVSTYVTRTKFGRPGSTSNLEIYYDIAGSEEARITRNYTVAVLKFNRGSTTDMIIDGGGNVGIGTTSPTAKLQIEGNNIIVNTEGSAQAKLLYFRYSNGATINSDSYLTFGTGGSPAERMRIDSGGNIGIGTTGPGAKLDVGYTSYNANQRSLYVRNTAGSINNNSYDTMVIQQDDVTSLRIVERNVGGTDQVMAISIGDGLARIAVTAQPLQFMVNGSASGISYQGLSGTMALQIGTNGNIGIGTTSTSYALDVSGTIRATADIIAYSDARVKENVNTITDALTKVTSLRGVSYTRNDSEDKSEKVGVIAQEVLEILPQVVQQDAEGKYSVAYGNIVGVLIEAIKELNAKIDRLENK